MKHSKKFYIFIYTYYHKYIWICECKKFQVFLHIHIYYHMPIWIFSYVEFKICLHIHIYYHRHIWVCIYADFHRGHEWDVMHSIEVMNDTSCMTCIVEILTFGNSKCHDHWMSNIYEYGNVHVIFCIYVCSYRILSKVFYQKRLWCVKISTI